jgi:hypothetical protein
MLIDLAVVVIAGLVFVVMLMSLARPGHRQARPSGERAEPGEAAGPGEPSGSGGSRPRRATPREQVVATAPVMIRADAGNFPAWVRDYSVDGSGLSVLGAVLVQRGDHVLVRLEENDTQAEVRHPAGTVNEREWAVGLFFPARKDRLRVLEYIRAMTGVPEAGLMLPVPPGAASTGKAAEGGPPRRDA